MRRRTVLGAIAGTATIAGCTDMIGGGGEGGGDGGGGDGGNDGGGNGGGDGGDGNGGDGDGGDGDGGSGDDGTPTPAADADEPTATPSPTPTATPTPAPMETATGTGASAPPASVRTPGSDDDHDWEAIGDQSEVGPFDGPEDMPTAFGWSRVSTTNTMTFSYGAMMGETNPVESGTVYLLFIVDDDVQQVLVWETPIAHGEEFTVGPEDSALAMDVGSLTDLVIAYDDGSEVYVVDKNADLLG